MANANGFNETDHPRDDNGEFSHKEHGLPVNQLVIATSPEAEAEIEYDVFGNELGRGKFPRNGLGAALVTDPDGAVYPDSNKQKAGKIKMVPYGAPSSKAVPTSTFNLQQWRARKALEALLRQPELYETARERLGEVDQDDEEAVKDVMADVLVESEEAAKIDEAARRGTFTHWLTECADRGESPVEGVADGEALGITPEMAERIATEWQATMEEYGIESLAVEQQVVNDEFRGAGTFDRLGRFTRDVTIPSLDGDVVIPTGTNVIVDLKTGKFRPQRTKKYSENPAFWEKYSAQLAVYAGGVPYDSKTGQRGTWNSYGGPPSQDYGVIIYGDLKKIAEGKGDSFKVYAVDLGRGRNLAAASDNLRSAEKAAGKDTIRPIR